jgi:hypothetical protein
MDRPEWDVSACGSPLELTRKKTLQAPTLTANSVVYFVLHFMEDLLKVQDFLCSSTRNCRTILELQPNETPGTWSLLLISETPYCFAAIATVSGSLVV